jgi:hypothetical protein
VKFVRTFADLMAKRPAASISTCRFCITEQRKTGKYDYKQIGWYYSTRAAVCTTCAQAKRDDVMPHVITAERRARQWLKGGKYNHEPRFIAGLVGLPESRVVEIIEELRGAA